MESPYPAPPSPSPFPGGLIGPPNPVALANANSGGNPITPASVNQLLGSPMAGNMGNTSMSLMLPELKLPTLGPSGKRRKSPGESAKAVKKAQEGGFMSNPGAVPVPKQPAPPAAPHANPYPAGNNLKGPSQIFKHAPPPNQQVVPETTAMEDIGAGVKGVLGSASNWVGQQWAKTPIANTWFDRNVVQEGIGALGRASTAVSGAAGTVGNALWAAGDTVAGRHADAAEHKRLMLARAAQTGDAIGGRLLYGRHLGQYENLTVPGVGQVPNYDIADQRYQEVIKNDPTMRGMHAGGKVVSDFVVPIMAPIPKALPGASGMAAAAARATKPPTSVLGKLWNSATQPSTGATMAGRAVDQTGGRLTGDFATATLARGMEAAGRRTGTSGFFDPLAHGLRRVTQSPLGNASQVGAAFAGQHQDAGQQFDEHVQDILKQQQQYGTADTIGGAAGSDLLEGGGIEPPPMSIPGLDAEESKGYIDDIRQVQAGSQDPALQARITAARNQAISRRLTGEGGQAYEQFGSDPNAPATMTADEQLGQRDFAGYGDDQERQQGALEARRIRDDLKSQVEKLDPTANATDLENKTKQLKGMDDTVNLYETESSVRQINQLRASGANPQMLAELEKKNFTHAGFDDAQSTEWDALEQQKASGTPMTPEALKKHEALRAIRDPARAKNVSVDWGNASADSKANFFAAKNEFGFDKVVHPAIQKQWSDVEQMAEEMGAKFLQDPNSKLQGKDFNSAMEMINPLITRHEMATGRSADELYKQVAQDQALTGSELKKILDTTPDGKKLVEEAGGLSQAMDWIGNLDSSQQSMLMLGLPLLFVAMAGGGMGMPLMLGAILGMGFWKNKDNPIAGIGEGFQSLLGGLGGMFGGGDKESGGGGGGGGSLAEKLKEHREKIIAGRRAVQAAGGYDEFVKNKGLGHLDYVFDNDAWSGRMANDWAKDTIGDTTARHLMTVPNDEFARLMAQLGA
jgi:hypothetical protein